MVGAQPRGSLHPGRRAVSSSPTQKGVVSDRVQGRGQVEGAGGNGRLAQHVQSAAPCMARGSGWVSSAMFEAASAAAAGSPRNASQAAETRMLQTLDTRPDPRRRFR
jgi:hypothetical protein